MKRPRSRASASWPSPTVFRFQGVFARQCTAVYAVVALELLTEAAIRDGHLTDGAIRRYEAYRSVLSNDATERVTSVLHVLEHDGYLARRDDGYHFVSGLVEDWWRARNGRGFVPFSERQG